MMFLASLTKLKSLKVDCFEVDNTHVVPCIYLINILEKF